MSSELRRSFSQKAKVAFGLPFRFRMGLERRDPEVSGGSILQGAESEEFATRSASFDFGCFTPVNNKLETLTKSSNSETQPASVDDFVMIESTDKKLKQKSSSFIQPKGTKQYTVSSTDTLPRIAAQFETTTSELKKLNRLMSDMVFPGKIIYIPDKNYVAEESVSESSSPTHSPLEAFTKELEGEQVAGSDTLDIAQKLGSGSVRMLDPDLLLMGVKPILSVARQSSSASAGESVSDGTKQTDEEWNEQFIKLNVKHIINEKDEVVSGMLLITPSALMFESNGNDECVLRNGRDEYDIVIPMSAVVGVVISQDHRPSEPCLKEMSSFEDDVFCKQDANNMPNDQTTKDTVLDNFTISQQDFAKSLSSSKDISTICEADKERNDIIDQEKPEGLCSSTDHDLQALRACLPMLDFISSKGDSVLPETPLLQSLPSDINRQDTSGQNLDTFTANSIDVSSSSDILAEKDGRSVSVDQDNNAYPDVNDKVDQMTEDGRDDMTNKGGKDLSTYLNSESKQAKTNGKFSASCDFPQLRHNTFPGNLFRLHSDDFTQESPCQSYDKKSEKDSEVVANKELLGESPVHAQRLVTRTLESLTSYSRPLVDLSSSLFSRSSSDSKSPKRDDEKAEMSSSPESLKEKDRYPDPPVQAQRVFFLRPFDLFTRKSRASSTELVEETNLSEVEQTLVADAEEPSTLSMCVKIGQFSNWSDQESCPVESYLTKRLKPEYRFTIPSTRVDHLYAFFLQWSPNMLDEMDQVNAVEKGFVVLSSAETGFTGFDKETNRLHFPGASCPANKEWEVVNAREVRRMINVAEIESLPLPELSEASKIMHSSHVRELSFHLPPRAEGCPWTLVYSTDKHGFSLKTMYRQLARVDSPVLLIIKDDSNVVFGAMLPCTIKMSDGFYGSGESYLFSFYSAFRKFSWTGHNNYFIKGNAESLSVGAGEGVYGLWLDGDLYHGRSQPCLTYNNSLLTVGEDFMIQCLEVWKFV